MSGKTKKRRVRCLCGCQKEVTTETHKAHMRVKHGNPRPTLRPKLMKLRQKLRRLSSRESIQAHHASSSVQEPGSMHSNSPTPADSLPSPSALDPSASQELENIPELDLTMVWEQVMRAPQRVEGQHTRSLTDLEESTISFESVTDEDLEESDGDSDIAYNPATNGLSPESRIRGRFLVEAAKNAPTALLPQSLDDIKTFNFLVKDKPSVSSYKTISNTFVHKDSHTPLPSLKVIRRRILALSALKPVQYHCCKNSCICYTGYLRDLTRCPHCDESRLNPAGSPWATFDYVPLIPQLLALYRNKDTSQQLRYRSNYTCNDDTLDDIFSGKRYEELKKTHVTIDGVRQPYRHFEDPREIALGLSVDGMCPFKRRKQSCWPLILINYSLPLDVRTHLHNILCVGVVPGPHSPKDLNSFLQPLIDELIELAKGVEAVDMLTEELFALRAYLVTAFGDIPAISKLLEFLGHNACYPCRFCMILAIKAKTANGGTHLYCPLHRTNGPDCNPLKLPLRTHAETLRQGYEVLKAPNDTARASLASNYGVKGVSLLARLSSMSIPASFPVEVMHMVWINLIPQLAELWTGQFNGLDDGIESYAIDSILWNSIGNICDASGATIPSSFGCRVPHFKKRYQFTAESWSLWATQLAPNLLRRRFKNSKYYLHFVRLINLMKEVTSHDLKRSALPQLREGFAGWVNDYEKYYYQYDAKRMQTCSVNVHYLLHIVDSVEYLGPVWAYWAFPMERYCSFIGSSVKSRRYPYANIANRIRDVAQLRIIREVYDLRDTITFGHTRASTEEEEIRAGDIGNADLLPNYPGLLLLTPRTERLAITPQLANKIAKHLSTVYRITMPVAKSFIPQSLKQWGRMRIVGGGDLIHARGYHKLRSDGRDASFVRYELMTDRRSHHRNAPEDLVQKSYYGQLQHILALPLEPNTAINPEPHAETLLLALIFEAKVTTEITYEYRVVWYEDNLSAGEVVDAESIQCVLGRVQDNKRWYIIDRSSKLARPTIV